MAHDRNAGSPAPPPGQGGWFKAWRNPDATELWQKHRPAFYLLWLIASRARYTDGFTAHDLERGQAFIGKMDCERHGISEQEYRTAKRILQEGHFATFKPTNQGTVVTLINTGIFDPIAAQGNEPSNERPTSDQRAGNERVTPNKKERKKKEKKDNNFLSPAAGKNVSFEDLVADDSCLYDGDFETAWNDWQAFRLEIGKPLTALSAKAQVAKLQAMGLSAAIASITQAIEGGHTSLIYPRE